MRADSIKLYIYGPDRENTKEKLEAIIEENALSDVVYIGDSLLGQEKENTYSKEEQINAEKVAEILINNFDEELDVSDLRAILFNIDDENIERAVCENDELL